MTSSHYALSQNHYKQDLQGHEERRRRQFHFLDQALNFNFSFFPIRFNQNFNLQRLGAAALPEEIFGMKSRSRRGSQDNVLDAEHGKRLEKADEVDEDLDKKEEKREPPPLVVVKRPGDEEKEKGKDLGNLTARKDKAEAPIKTNGRSEKSTENPGEQSCDDRAALEYWVPVVVQPSYLEGLVGAHPGIAKVPAFQLLRVS